MVKNKCKIAGAMLVQDALMVTLTT